MITGLKTTMVSGLLCLVVSGDLGACVLPPRHESLSDIWIQLSIYDAESQPARDRLTGRLRLVKNRERALEFIEESVKCSSIGHEDQLRLAALLTGVRNEATTESEHARICRAIHAGFELSDFYALCLSPAPPYVEIVIEALRSDREFLAMDPVAGGTKRMSLREWAAWLLSKATGREFGLDYESWKGWWNTEGRSLAFDEKTLKYATPAEK